MPDDKYRYVEEALQSSKTVGFIGDGVNDAPVITLADIGIAMGSGTDIALDSADVIVLNSRLTAVAEALDVSARSYRHMRQNVGLAFLFNGIGIPLAATGLLVPVWAMVAMAASVTAIFSNSLWGRPGLLLDTVRSVGRPDANAGPRDSANPVSGDR